ncbi:uncharacterized protein LOC128163390 [Crassostrea angulata]|nr:uncharacterized protein LOC128163390 [Crassostrea angulata]
MPPVRLRQSKLSNKQVQRQRTSPARGRGRRRTVQPDEAATSSDTVNVSASIMPTQMIEESQQPPQQAGLNTAASSVAEPMQQSTAGNNSPNTSHGTQANTSLFTLGHTPIKLPRL